jgi:ABC-type branched-subunit amino acid transport system substrate-binding protein
MGPSMGSKVMKRIIGIVLLLLLGMTAECLGAVDAGTIRIGVAGPRPEDAQQANVPYAKNALELFKQDFAGKLGRKLRVEVGEVELNVDFVYREYGSLSEAVTVAKEFAQDDSIVAVIGYPTSAKATQVGKIFDANKLALITPTATNPRVTRGNDWVFSMIYTDDWQGAVIAAYIRKLHGWKNVALIYEDSPEKDNVYERGLAESFRAAAKDYGVNIVDTLRLPTDSDLKSIFHDSENVPTKKSLDAVVLFATTDEALQIVLKIRQLDARVPIVVPDGLSGRTFVQDTRNIHRALHLSQPRVLVANRLFYELAPLKAGEFRRSYKSKYKGEEPRIYEVFTYDAALLISWAAMKAIAEEGDAKLSAKDLRSAVQQNLMKLDCRRRALPGISGELYFDSEGAMSRNVLFAWISDVGSDRQTEVREGGSAIPRLRPAYRQFKDVSINDCGRRSKSSVRSAAKPSSRVKQANETSPRQDPHHMVIQGRDMKKVYVVRTGIDFYRINEIDIGKQRFDIETFVWFKWKGPLEILPTAQGQNPMDILLFWNGIHGLEDKTDLLITEKQDGNELKTLAFKVKGTYVQHYALKNYPFDTQNLSLYLSLANKNTDEVWLVVDDGMVQSTKEIVQRYGENNFKIFPGEYAPTKSEHVAGTTALPSSLGNPHQKRSGGSANDFSVYEASLEVKRDMFPYFLTLFLPLGILTAVSLGVFWIPLGQFAVRITIVLTTLLSVLVFHLSRADSLPNVGYLTVADKFFIAAYIGMSVNIGLTILYEWLRNAGRATLAEKLNGVVRYILVAVTILFIALVGSPAVERLVGEQRYWRVVISLLVLWAGIEIVVRSVTIRSALATTLHVLTFRTAKEGK